MKKVILLFGGVSFEHEVSCKSAGFILENINKRKYECLPVGISKEGNWYLYHEDNIRENWMESITLEPVKDIIGVLKEADIVFPMIHGTYGEDGRIQSLCEVFNIKCVGCDSKTSMLCMDKEYMKMVAEKHGIPIVDYRVVEQKDLKREKKFPIVVKPANGGSSIGIGIASNWKELKAKYKEASLYDSKVIIEDYKKVRELEVAVVTNKKKCYISGIGEIITDGEFYDYHNKYVTSKNTSLEADIPKNIESTVYDLVEKLVDIFNIMGMARIDFFYVEEENTVYFNEVNTIPGFTGISMFPALLKDAGINFTKLVTMLIESY